jgi:hypothetical protein
MLAVMIASHFVSPVLWDHYALVLLLPTAWLLDRGRRWAIAIPLLTSALALPLDIPFLYPLAFWLALAAVVAVGMRERMPETLRAQAPS